MKTNLKLPAGHTAEALHTVLELPEVEPWPEPVNGAKLLDELERTLLRFVVLPKWSAETLALWILHTYAAPLRDVSTYIGLESPEKRCGKTTLLTVLSELVNRPVVAANISSPALFRVIEETRPTLLIDEADTLLQGNDELRGILNAGYTRKTAFVVRVDSQFTHYQLPAVSGADRPTAPDAGLEAATHAATRLVRYTCWCPKIMAAIGHLPETLADRCIVVQMHRKSARERCERSKDLAAGPLRQQCARFVLDYAEKISAAMPAVPPDLHDRAGDIWEPLLALADLAGEAWPEKARQAALGLTATAQEHSPIGALLMDLLILFVQDGTGRIHSRKLIEALSGGDDRPWVDALKGKKLTQNWLARQLKPYGIRPKSMWIGEVSGKGYLQEDFEEVFPRYIPRSEFEELKAAQPPPVPTLPPAAEVEPDKPPLAEPASEPGV